MNDWQWQLFRLGKEMTESYRKALESNREAAAAIASELIALGLKKMTMHLHGQSYSTLHDPNARIRAFSITETFPWHAEMAACWNEIYYNGAPTFDDDELEESFPELEPWIRIYGQKLFWGLKYTKGMRWVLRVKGYDSIDLDNEGYADLVKKTKIENLEDNIMNDRTYMRVPGSTDVSHLPVGTYKFTFWIENTTSAKHSSGRGIPSYGRYYYFEKSESGKWKRLFQIKEEETMKKETVKKQLGEGLEQHKLRVSEDGASITISPTVLDNVKKYYESNKHKAPLYGAPWYRVLQAFGYEVGWEGPPSRRPQGPLTIKEAEEGNAKWPSGWGPVLKELIRIKTFKEYHNYDVKPEEVEEALDDGDELQFHEGPLSDHGQLKERMRELDKKVEALEKKIEKMLE